MTGQDVVEELFWKELKAHEAMIGAMVIRGVSAENRPENYVAVIAYDENERAPGVSTVSLRIAIVAALHKDGHAEWFRRVVDFVSRHLGPDCALRHYETESVRICGYAKRPGGQTRGTNAVARFLEYLVGVQVA